MRLLIITCTTALLLPVCSSGQKPDSYFIKAPIKKNSNIAVLVRGNNQIKNTVYIEFLKAGYNVKAFNASDFTQVSNVFDHNDVKSLAENITQNGKNDSQWQVAALFTVYSRQYTRTKYADSLFDNIFNNLEKMHIYSYESSKADLMAELKKKYRFDYIVLLSMSNWDQGYAWTRVIDVDSKDLVYVHNYPPKFNDSYNTIIRRLVAKMQEGK